MRWYHQASDDHTHRGRRNDRSLHGEEMVRHVGQACGRRRCAQEGQARWYATVHERREEEVETGDGSLFDGKLEVNESGGEMNGAEAIVLSLKVSSQDSILARAVSARNFGPIGVMAVRRVSGKGG